MTEQTITFTPKAEFKKGFSCLLKGFVLIFRSIGRQTDHAVRRYPWAFLVATVLISVILCFFFIGKARSERDATRTSVSHAGVWNSKSQIILLLRMPHGKPSIGIRGL